MQIKHICIYSVLSDDNDKSIIGYVNTQQLLNDPTNIENKLVKNFMIKFNKKSAFKVLTPETPLEVLEEFFKSNSFAIS